MDKIYQCGIYKKGYRPQDMVNTFFFGMGLDASYNYIGITILLDEEELIEPKIVEVSNIEGEEVEIKKVKGFICFFNNEINDNIIAIPYRVYEVKEVRYINPFYK